MRILFVRLSSFGDVVFSLPAARALKEGVGGATLAWAIEEPLAPIVAGAPFVDEVVHVNTREWRRAPLAAGTVRAVRASLAATRAFRPDVVVDAQGLFKSAWLTFLVPAERKVGFGWRTATERVNCLATNERVEADGRPHSLDRALALAEHVTGRTGFPRTPDVSHLVAKTDAGVDSWLEDRRRAPFALLQPFASKADKTWRTEDVLPVARGLLERGLPPVVRWGPGERERAEELATASGGTLVLAPPTTPSSTARLSSRATLFIGVDTGPTHLAAATGTATLALFGPTSPARFGPVGPRATFLEATSGEYTRDRPRNAMWPPDDVLKAVESLLA